MEQILDTITMNEKVDAVRHEVILGSLQYAANSKEVNVEEINKIVLLPENQIWLDSNGNEIPIGDYSRADKMLLNTHVPNTCGDDLWIGIYFVKNGFAGGYVAPLDKLTSKKRVVQESRQGTTSNVNEEDDASRKVVNLATAEEVYSLVANKETWTNKKLQNYLIIIAQKICKQIENGNHDDILVATDDNGNEWVVFNSGLLDSYMNDIYIVAKHIALKRIEDPQGKRYVVTDHFMEDGKVVDGIRSLAKYGFQCSRIKMPNVLSMIRNQKLIFNYTLENFDLYNRRNIDHILNTRKYRINGAELSSDVLYGKLQRSIEIAVKRQQRDFRHIVPMYNPRYDEIQYMIPFYVGDSLIGKADAAIIVVERDGLCEIKTILDIGDAYLNARIIAPVHSEWLIDSAKENGES